MSLRVVVETLFGMVVLVWGEGGGVVCGLRMGVGVGGPGSRVEGVVCSRGNVSVAGGRAR